MMVRSEAAKQALVMGNLGLVHAVARRRLAAIAGDPDLIQSGMEGLCKAADKWQERGKFANYASTCIYNSMCAHLRETGKWERVHSATPYEATADVRGATDIHDDIYAQICRHWPEGSRQRYMLLSLAEGKSKREVAQALGVSTNVVTRAARRAVERMGQAPEP